MANQKTDDAVYWTARGAVNWVLRRAVEDPVSWDVWWDVNGAVDDAVNWAVRQDSPHHGLQDFLRFAGVVGS